MGLKREYLHMDNNARGKKTTPERTPHTAQQQTQRKRK